MKTTENPYVNRVKKQSYLKHRKPSPHSISDQKNRKKSQTPKRLKKVFVFQRLISPHSDVVEENLTTKTTSSYAKKKKKKNGKFFFDLNFFMIFGNFQI